MESIIVAAITGGLALIGVVHSNRAAADQHSAGRYRHQAGRIDPRGAGAQQLCKANAGGGGADQGY